MDVKFTQLPNSVRYTQSLPHSPIPLALPGPDRRPPSGPYAPPPAPRCCLFLQAPPSQLILPRACHCLPHSVKRIDRICFQNAGLVTSTLCLKRFQVSHSLCLESKLCGLPCGRPSRIQALLDSLPLSLSTSCPDSKLQTLQPS